MTSHFHYGHAVTGDSPEREHLSTCLTLRCLADCVRNELSGIVDMLADEAYAQERDGRDLESRLGQSGSTDMLEAVIRREAVADRYRAALDCHAMISDTETLGLNLSPERERAPLYVGQPDLWEATLRKIIFEADNFPLYTDSAETRQFRVWECSESWCDWTHADYPHEPGRLRACRACETRCYCTGAPGHTDCVHCALVESGETTCDETSGCEAHS